ncbi:MAG: antibiotic biosynthesis monooxygenase [Clostridiaceae bacterium]|nr:antibiotic biosynthesis monooxygenase [Clostridiaceae bacterium]
MIKLEVTYVMNPEVRDEFYNAIVEQGIDVAAANEEGNYGYKFEVPARSELLLLHELWKDEAALTAHGQMPHFKALAALKEKYGVTTNIEKEILLETD